MAVHKNLRMPLLFVKNNVQAKLHATVMNEIDKYKLQEKGGPLYYIILIELMLNDGVSIALVWIQKVKQLDIKTIKREDILMFRKWGKGLLSLCKALEEGGSSIIVTVYFPDIIISLLANTSSDEFNNVFRQKGIENLTGTTA